MTESDVRKALSLGIFAINLERSADRWSRLKQSFGGLPYPLIRVAALDARLEPQAVLNVRGLSMQLPPEGLGWTLVRGREYLLVQEACFTGHILALRQFLDSDFDLALILEDDAEPDARLGEILEAIAWIVPPFDLIKLEGMRHSGSRLAVPVAQLGRAQLVRSLRPSAGSAAYVVSRSAAQKMLRNAGRLLLPFDDYLSSPSLNGCDLLYVSPMPIRQAEGPSIIAESYDRHRLRKQRGAAAYLRQAATRLGLRLGVWRGALGRGGWPRNAKW